MLEEPVNQDDHDQIEWQKEWGLPKQWSEYQTNWGKIESNKATQSVWTKWTNWVQNWNIHSRNVKSWCNDLHWLPQDPRAAVQENGAKSKQKWRTAIT